jgi:hypothetical protein|tara:strand:- start:338 stop:517 length:180 start_codon:yes stop_codon:yes gene_type:complete
MADWRESIGKDNLKLLWDKIIYQSNDIGFKLGLAIAIAFIAFVIMLSLFKSKTKKRIKK